LLEFGSSESGAVGAGYRSRLWMGLWDDMRNQVAESGSLPLKRQGIEQSVPARDSIVLRWHSEIEHFVLKGMKCFFDCMKYRTKNGWQHESLRPIIGW